MHKFQFMQVFFPTVLYTFLFIIKNMLLTKPNPINSVGFFILD